MRPRILGLGGTLRPHSTSECALGVALAAAEKHGADVTRIVGANLDVRQYDPSRPDRTAAEQDLVRAFRETDGVIIASPGYHGATSGLVKNALDYVEDLLNDQRVYFADLPIGCISVAYGDQAAVTTLAGLRTIAHALRAFPTPYGAAIVAGPQVFNEGVCIDARTSDRLALVGMQVADLAHRLKASLPIGEGTPFC